MEDNDQKILNKVASKLAEEEEVTQTIAYESTEANINKIKMLCRYIFDTIDEGYEVDGSELVAHCKDDARGELLISIKVSVVNTKNDKVIAQTADE